MGQMCWLPKLGSNGEKVLHLRLQSYEPWKPYNTFPNLATPDYRVPGGSKGWATYQALKETGQWDLVASPGAVVPLDAIANSQKNGLVQGD